VLRAELLECLVDGDEDLGRQHLLLHVDHTACACTAQQEERVEDEFTQ
jgi:hypothetical protein